MDWEKGYSISKIHFFGQMPTWVSIVDWDCNGKILVDLGAGDGVNSYYLKGKYSECRVFSLDRSHIRCLRCRDNANSLVIQGDCCRLPFRSCSVDFVVCTMVIEHVSNDMELIKEIERVLKPGGKALISSVIRKRFGIYFYRNSKGQFMLDPTHLREYSSTTEFRSLFEDLLRIDRLEISRICFSPARFIYRLLYSAKVIRNPDSTFFQRSLILRLLTRIRLCIPRYRKIEVEAVKSKA
jgi:ubiquinone/menaquinone biosynthesis C-methylase UbiE